MIRWKDKRSTGGETADDQESSNQSKKDCSFDSTESDGDDIHNASFNTYLLFPKESPSTVKDPLFPTAPRKNFCMMTCRRTMFACRGPLLFCLIVLLVISLVSSFNSGGDGANSTEYEEVTSNPKSSSTLGLTANSSQSHRLEALPLPPAITGRENSSQVTVSYNVDCAYGVSDYAVLGNALRKGLEFYEANANNITVLDAALGTKIVTEQLVQIQKHHQNLPLTFQRLLQGLNQKSDSLTKQIIATVKRASNGKEDFSLTMPWIETEGLWDLPFSGIWHSVGKLKSYNPPDGESFEQLWNIVSVKEIINETESDACIFQVFHCDVEKITEKCRKVFLDKESSMYSLTHQVIFMLLAQKNKCYEKATWKQVPALANGGNPFLEKLCGKVWQEANSIAEANFPPKFRDLLIEQVGMCSLAGYSDFLRRDWLRRIISWQSISTSGCFGERRRRVPNIGMLLREYQNQQNGHYSRKLDRPSSMSINENVYRVKRSDMLLDSGNAWEKCSVHFTSVGITALSLHLRYFFDTCLDAY